MITNLKKLVNKHEDSLTKKEQDYIINFAWKTSNFYVLPKIHKNKDIIDQISSSEHDFIEISPPQDLKGRPIIAGPVSPTQRLSEFLDTLLKPIVTTLKTYIKDDWDFIRKLPKEFESNSSLFSYNVVSLYTSIPHELGLEAIKFWITKKRSLIPDRFSHAFILESVRFVLINNNFLFDNVMYKQVKGTAMGTKFAPSYACLTVGFLEETLLFPIVLPKYFSQQICKYIETNYFCYMDDGFIALPEDIDPNLLQHALNELNPSIKFTMEKGQKNTDNIESLNFLDIKILLHNGTRISTDIFYKETNPHKYLNFKSAHPSHIKDTIPFNLAKRIVVFVSDPQIVEIRLNELEHWLLDCSYPKNLIKQAFHRAKLQGPAPEPKKKDIIPLVTTYYPSLKYNNVLKTISTLLKSFKDNTTKHKFINCKPLLALKQPPNITSILTTAKFNSEENPSLPGPHGITLCNNRQCKLCRSYLQPVDSFLTSNGTFWSIRSHVTCKSKNIVYFLSCNLCEGRATYIGQTTNLRQRMNNHISESRTGISPCTFPRHIFSCGAKNKNLKEPFFKVFAFMQLKDPRLLLSHEEKLIKAGHATLN